MTNGSITLNIGDYINYDPGTETTYTSEVGIDQTQTTPYKTYGPGWNDNEQEWINYKALDYQKLLENDENKDIKNKGNGYKNQTYLAGDIKNGNIKWKVLGTDDEKGELLIITEDVLKNEDNSTKKFALRGITGYLHGVDELNNICNVYGQGKGATGGRSVTYDDIDKAIGKEKITVAQPWTYLWTTSSLTKKAPYYSYQNGEGYLDFSHLIKDTTIGVFNYYNDKQKKWETKENDLSRINETKEFATIVKSYNGYNINDTNGDSVQLRERYKATKGYDVLFKTGEETEIKEKRYWLSSSYCSTNPDYVGWGIYYVYDSGYIYGSNLYHSFGLIDTPSYGIRPIISLKSNIKLQENSTSNNTYDIMD